MRCSGSVRCSQRTTLVPWADSPARCATTKISISARFRFFQASSSGYARKRDTIRQYPRGAETTCYISPADPEEAVLDRSFPAEENWFGMKDEEYDELMKMLD